MANHPTNPPRHGPPHPRHRGQAKGKDGGGGRRGKRSRRGRLCPLPPPPTRRSRDLWPSFTDIAMTKITVEREEEGGDSEGRREALTVLREWWREAEIVVREWGQYG